MDWIFGTFRKRHTTSNFLLYREHKFVIKKGKKKKEKEKA